MRDTIAPSYPTKRSLLPMPSPGDAAQAHEARAEEEERGGFGDTGHGPAEQLPFLSLALC